MNSDLYSTNLITWGYEECPPGHEFGGKRDYFLLHIIRTGRGEFISRGKRWTLNTGDAFLIFPEQMHLYRGDFKNPWSYFWLGFKGEFSGIFTSLHLDEDHPIIHSDNPEDLFRIYQEISEQQINQHPGITLENLGSLNTILGKLCKNRTISIRHSKACESRVSHHVHTMETYIQSNFITPIQVQDVIDYVRLERSYASRIFKEQTGFSIGESILKLRLDLAEKNLKEGWSAKETAYSCGYSNYHNFLKAFKKSTGMTTTEFKNT